MTSFADRVGDLLSELWEGNLHAGYWYDENDPATFERAADQLTDQVAARLDPVPGQRMLDVGCGVGGPALRVAARHDVRVVGFSINARQVHRARRNAAVAGLADRVGFVRADVSASPFGDGSFDAAWAIEAMCDLPDRDQTLREVARILRPGARLVIADIFAPESGNGAVGFDDYRGLVERAGMTLLDLADISAHTAVPPAATATLIATLRRRRDRYTRMVGSPMYQRLTDSTVNPFGYPGVGYLIATARR